MRFLEHKPLVEISRFCKFLPTRYDEIYILSKFEYDEIYILFKFEYDDIYILFNLNH